MNPDIKAINEKIEKESAFVDNILNEVSKVIVGQNYMIERLLIGLLSNGHILLEGVPGLAKTLTVKSLSQCVKTKFQRIQFTPDLLPADLLGTLIYNQKDGTYTTKKGPIFGNLILADEINRSPAKVSTTAKVTIFNNGKRQSTFYISDNSKPQYFSIEPFISDKVTLLFTRTKSSSKVSGMASHNLEISEIRLLSQPL